MRPCKHHSPLRHLFRATYVNDHCIHVTRKPFTVSKKPGGTVEPDYRTIRRFDIYCCTGTLYNLDINTTFLQFPFVYLCVTTTCVVSAYHYYSCEFEPRSWRGVLDTTLCDKVCQWLAAGWWFSPGTPVSSTNKIDRHDITEILLKVALDTIKPSFVMVDIWIWKTVYNRNRNSLHSLNKTYILLRRKCKTWLLSIL